MENNSPKKICFVITSRVHFARCRRLLEMLLPNRKLKLQLVIGGSALMDKHGNVLAELEEAGFKTNKQLFINIGGGDNFAMSQITGKIILKLSKAIQKLNPTFVVVRGDRYEMLAAATAAAYMNKTIVHIEGGDVSGNIDESVRHAITKLAHIHFVPNEKSKQRVLAMGENAEYVFNVGSLDIEYLNYLPEITDYSFINQSGQGAEVDVGKPFLMVLQHPVTSDENNYGHLQEILKAVDKGNLPTLWFAPNIDAGNSEISRAIKDYLKEAKPQNIRFIDHLPAEQFLNLLKKTACFIGNSSAGIKECSYLGTPFVLVGNRQNNRYQGKNVIQVDYRQNDILEALEAQLAHGKYDKDDYFYQESTSGKIIDVLENIEPYTQKSFYDKQ